MWEEKSLKKPWPDLTPPLVWETVRRALRRVGPGSLPPNGKGKLFLTRSWRWGVGLLITAVLLILAHGCHGEEVDDEPAFIAAREDQRPSRLGDE
jgi:hypothetical protein